jgi:hypothetical protein
VNVTGLSAVAADTVTFRIPDPDGDRPWIAVNGYGNLHISRLQMDADVLGWTGDRAPSAVMLTAEGTQITLFSAPSRDRRRSSSSPTDRRVRARAWAVNRIPVAILFAPSTCRWQAMP